VVRTRRQRNALEALASAMLRRKQYENAVQLVVPPPTQLHGVRLDKLASQRQDYEHGRRIRHALAVLEGHTTKRLTRKSLDCVAGLVRDSVRVLGDGQTWARMDALEQCRYAQNEGVWKQLAPYKEKLANPDWVSAVLGGELVPGRNERNALLTILRQRGEPNWDWRGLKEAEARLIQASQQSLAAAICKGDLLKIERTLSKVNDNIAKHEKELAPSQGAAPKRQHKGRLRNESPRRRSLVN
jgi:hypothetical protein